MNAPLAAPVNESELVNRLFMLQLLCPEMVMALRRTDWWGVVADLYVCRFFGLPACQSSYDWLKRMAIRECGTSPIVTPFNKEGDLIEVLWQLLRDLDRNTRIYRSDEEKEFA